MILIILTRCRNDESWWMFENWIYKRNYSTEIYLFSFFSFHFFFSLSLFSEISFLEIQKTSFSKGCYSWSAINQVSDIDNFNVMPGAVWYTANGFSSRYFNWYYRNAGSFKTWRIVEVPVSLSLAGGFFLSYANF